MINVRNREEASSYCRRISDEDRTALTSKGTYVSADDINQLLGMAFTTIMKEETSIKHDIQQLHYTEDKELFESRARMLQKRVEAFETKRQSFLKIRDKITGKGGK
ncbi:hypothetical protein D3C75_894210 [compost metagenome]